MGSTFSSGKEVAAFKATDGAVHYVLFEQTCESNVYPRTPTWSCVALGNLKAIMNRIFVWASSCEGGMIKGAGGRDITPEGYIAGWMKALANPVTITDRQIGLQAGDTYRSTLSEDCMERVQAVMVDHGYTDAAESVGRGERVIVSLYADAAMLAELYAGMMMGPWRIIQPDHSGIANPDLAYNPTKAKNPALSEREFMQVAAHGGDCLELGDDGCWRSAGRAYSVIASYVANLADAEIAEPGSYRKRIKHFRALVNGAPVAFRPGLKVIATMPPETHQYKYKRMNLQEAMETYAHDEREDGVHIAVPNADSMTVYFMVNLSPEHTQWVIPQAPADTGSDIQFDLLGEAV